MTPSAIKRRLGKRLLGSLLALAACLAGPAQALQVIPVREGETAFARVAADDLTRIAIEGGRIRSWHTLKGRLVIDKDGAGGQIFVRPLDREKPVSLFITAESGATYALTLQPVDVPAESLVLQEAARKAATPSAAERAASRQEMAKDLMIQAASDRIPEGMEVRERGEDVRLWQGTRFTLVRSWLGSSVVLDQYRLLNTGNEPMRMAEPELFRPGVLTVAIERQALAPGEETRVFVLRYREDGE